MHLSLPSPKKKETRQKKYDFDFESDAEYNPEEMNDVENDVYDEFALTIDE